MSQSCRHLFLLALLVCTAVSTTGCVNSFISTSADKQAKPFPNTSAENPMNRPPAMGGPSCSVAFYSKKKLIKEVKVPVTGPVYVQDVLEKSGATKHFGRMNVALLRKLSHGKLHRMDVEFGKRKKRVSVTSNYAVYPGDRLVVGENTDTALDDMLGSVAAPVSRVTGLGHTHSH